LKHIGFLTGAAGVFLANDAIIKAANAGNKVPNGEQSTRV